MDSVVCKTQLGLLGMLERGVYSPCGRGIRWRLRHCCTLVWSQQLCCRCALVLQRMVLKSNGVVAMSARGSSVMRADASAADQNPVPQRHINDLYLALLTVTRTGPSFSVIVLLVRWCWFAGAAR